jgi:peptide/nickel transport system ATP-binding protein/oligopeptide transport system ATP-binding protein
MRQRVMIAMAISCRPQLVIADEPTTAVDVTIQSQLMELIRHISQEMGMSLILITHNLGVVARYAQRVYVMYAGMVIEHGSAMDVYHTPYHPYTCGLLSSVPRLDEVRKVRLVPIDGQPPDLISLSPGCPFKPRCQYAFSKCETERPALNEISTGHFAACFMTDTGEMPWLKILSLK